MRTQTRFVLIGAQLLIGLLTLPLQPSWAEPVVLDFDDHASMANLLIIRSPSEARLSDDYLDSHGVLFRSEENNYVTVVNLGENHATSGANGIAGALATDYLTYYKPIYMSFFDPQNPAIPGTTDFVSLRGDTFGEPVPQTITLEAYDINGALLATDTTVDDGSSILSVSAPDIHRVKFIGATPGHGGVGVDDLTFNPVEPTTLLGVPNASFEQPEFSDGGWIPGVIDDWVVSGGPTSQTGVYNPIEDDYTGARDFDPGILPSPADWRQCAYIGQNDTGSISQTLEDLLLPDTDYTLTVALGNRKNQLMGAWKMELFGGTTSIAFNEGLAETATHAYAAPEGLFGDVTAFVSASDIETYYSSSLDEPLRIVLSRVAGSTASQVHFDNVRLDASPIPEPSAFILLTSAAAGLLCCLIRKRRRVA